MKQTRETKAKLNIAFSLLGQVATLFCGLIVPTLLINAFGSEVYGATASVAQFLAYITLIEGGIGGVARAALYGPLAQNDMQKVSAIMGQIKRFFRVIAYAFVGYVFLLACSFKYIADVNVLDWRSTFLLVLVVSVSTLSQYYIGVANSLLLQAAQKTYITRAVSIGGTVLNTAMIVLLVWMKADIITVKLASSCVFALQPIVLWIYGRKNFKLEKVPRSKEDYLKQRWNALGQHIAWFLHSNTDVAILTIFADLKTVAVYAVYNMIIGHIQAFATSFATGMEALFGDMLAKNEKKELHNAFNHYELMISLVVMVLLSTTAVLILPFVRIYTASIEDQNYIEPVFAIFLVVASALYCLRLPYHAVITAAGHFKQTRAAAYGEVIINLLLSVILVFKFGLAGVAIGTVVATLFRLVCYVIYLAKKIMIRKVNLFLKRIFVNTVAFVISAVSGTFAIKYIPCNNYAQWVLCGIVVFLVVAIVICGINILVYRQDMMRLLQRKKQLHRNTQD